MWRGAGDQLERNGTRCELFDRGRPQSEPARELARELIFFLDR